jgi:hypothetical protein
VGVEFTGFSKLEYSVNIVVGLGVGVGVGMGVGEGEGMGVKRRSAYKYAITYLP